MVKCCRGSLIKPGGFNAPYMLVFSDYDVKNRVTLEFPFDEVLTALIDEYVHLCVPKTLSQLIREGIA
jgi:hypothetical protein